MRTPADTQSDNLTPPPEMAAMSPTVLCILIGCVSIELALQAADLRLLGSPLWRNLAYQNGAFWPGLLHGWQPNYDAQPWVMFFTYTFLHGGFGHLAGNMITLLALGNFAVRRAGQIGFLAIYTIAALGGAGLFGAISASSQPMVGASGGLFGLAASWQYWEHIEEPDRSRRQGRLVVTSVFLVLVNIIFWVILDGELAWQTHLGGYVAGGLTAIGIGRWRRTTRSGE